MAFIIEEALGIPVFGASGDFCTIPNVAFSVSYAALFPEPGNPYVFVVAA